MSIHKKILEKSKGAENSSSQNNSLFPVSKENSKEENKNHYEANSLLKLNSQKRQEIEFENEKIENEIQRMKPFIRMTTDILPKSKTLFNQMKIPVGAIIQPYATDPYVIYVN